MTEMDCTYIGDFGNLLKGKRTEVIKESIQQVIQPTSPDIAPNALNLLVNADVDLLQKQESALSNRERRIYYKDY